MLSSTYCVQGHNFTFNNCVVSMHLSISTQRAPWCWQGGARVVEDSHGFSERHPWFAPQREQTNCSGQLFKMMGNFELCQLYLGSLIKDSMCSQRLSVTSEPFSLMMEVEATETAVARSRGSLVNNVHVGLYLNVKWVNMFQQQERDMSKITEMKQIAKRRESRNAPRKGRLQKPSEIKTYSNNGGHEDVAPKNNFQEKQ